jgi:hypothetical protein
MKFFKKLISAGVLVMLGFSVKAAIIYDNGVISANRYNGNAFGTTSMQQMGNEIYFTPGGFGTSPFVLTNFAIEYYTPDFSLAGVGIDVNFYYNNGTSTNGFPTPNIQFYSSGWYYGLAGGGYQVVTYATNDLYHSALPGFQNLAPGFLMPGDFTFTITFTNLGPLDSVFLPLATNTPGISFGDYWLHTPPPSWTLLSTNTADANLMVDFAGTPEPSTLGLAAIGGALLLGINRLRRKR